MVKSNNMQDDYKSTVELYTTGINGKVKRCLHIKVDGTQCGALASKGSNGNQLCSIHSGNKPWEVHRNGCGPGYPISSSGVLVQTGLGYIVDIRPRQGGPSHLRINLQSVVCQ